MQRTGPDSSGYVESAWRDSMRLARLAGRVGIDAAVPTCPGWAVRDLVHHVDGLGRGVVEVLTAETAAVPTADRMRSWFRTLPDPVLLDSFADGQRELGTALCEADPDKVCWTFRPTADPVGFWARRYAHEMAIHRVDVEYAAGLTATAFDPAFAADGVDELLAHVGRAGGPLADAGPGLLRIEATDTGDHWSLPLGRHGGAGTAECVLSGSAGDLYLELWNRGRYQADLLTTGRSGLLREWRERARWTFG